MSSKINKNCLSYGNRYNGIIAEVIKTDEIDYDCHTALEQRKVDRFWAQERKKDAKDQESKKCPSFEKTIITLRIGNGSKSFSRSQFSEFVKEINSLIKKVGN